MLLIQYLRAIPKLKSRLRENLDFGFGAHAILAVTIIQASATFFAVRVTELPHNVFMLVQAWFIPVMVGVFFFWIWWDFFRICALELRSLVIALGVKNE